MGKHRPVTDRIAETQAQLNALMAKAAKEQVNDDPAIQEIDKTIKTIQKDTLKYNRWAEEGEAKIQNFLLRTQLWRDRLAEAEDKKAMAAKELTKLRKQRKELAESLASEMAKEA
mgnify:FL=1